ncbi:MAG: F0F1 ATP synthase subunit A, partial [Flavobacteriaceae bacterium]
MRTRTYKAILTVLFLSLFTTGFAASNSEEKDPSQEEAFNASELIFHHIGDSHSFHVYGSDEDHFPKALTVPLPIILWTDSGLVSFMSSEFHHDLDGKVIVEKKGMKFVNLHDKIYQLKQGATAVNFDAEHHPINAAKPLDFSITKNVFSMFLSVALIILIFIFSARSYRKSSDNMPSGIGRFMEPIVVFIRDEVAIPNIGEQHYRRYMPFLLTLFFF